MKTHTDRNQENKSHAINGTNTKNQIAGKSKTIFADSRPDTVAHQTLNNMANNSPQALQAVQLKAIANSDPGLSVQMKSLEEEELLQGKFDTAQKNDIEANNTGLPDNLKTGIENLSGLSMDDVRVHYNSAMPEQLQAHAYAQGSDIHVAPGQEKHLPHEAWHIIQQKKGRVKPTMQMKGNVNINDDAGLEKEADVMGNRALVQKKGISGKSVAQLGKKKRDIKRAKKNNPNGVQHHLRPEYQEQNERQMDLVMGGMSRKEAKRQAKQEEKARKG